MEFKGRQELVENCEDCILGLRAKFRDDETSVVSAPSKNVQIHYEALPVERVEYEMRNF